jgi:ATP-binding cassette subfamily C protein
MDADILDPQSERLQAALGINPERVLRSTTGFWIDRGDSLHVVLDGNVDVFAVTREGNEPAGARHHIFRLGRGCVLLGMPRSAEPFGILAVPAPGAALAAIERNHSALRSHDPEQQAYDEVLGEALIRFVLAVTEGTVHGMPPKQYRPLTTGESASFGEGTVLSGVERLLWLQLDQGSLQLFGRDDYRIEAGTPGSMVPMSSRAWATVVGGDATVSAIAPSEDGFEKLWAPLTQWLDQMLDLATHDILAATIQETARLNRKAANATATMHDALELFVNVDNEAVAQGSLAVADDGETAVAELLSACRAVGRVAGIDFVAPARLRKIVPIDRAEEIAAATKVRYRRVMLRDEWWNTDNGPLLGFLQAGAEGGAQKPVALLPEKGDHYVLFDPATGNRQRVTPELAAGLSAFAMSFYRVFPPHSLALLDLARFGAFGMNLDLFRLLLAGALIGLLGMATPLVSGRLIDTVIPSADKVDVLALTAILVATTIASTLFGLSRSICVLRLEGKMDSALQAAVWDRVLSLPTNFFRRFAAGDLAMRINGINTLRHALSGAVMSSILTGVFSLFNLALLFYYNAKLAFAAMGLIVLALLVTGVTGYLKLRCERQFASLSGKISGMVYQYLTGIVKLRVCAAEGRAFANWAEQYTHLRGLMMRNARLANVEQTFYAGYGVVVNAVIFAMIGMVLFKDAQASLSTGDFIAFNSAFGTVFGAMMELSQTALGLLNLVPVYERTRPILETAPEVDNSKITPEDLSGEIEVLKLNFAYCDGPAVLSDVSFHVSRGEFVAVVGPSGSGKSTLLRLLMGFERPAAGSICYDSHNLLDLDVNALRRQLGVVLQSGQLMAGDIFTNIAGTAGVTLDEVWNAARLCGLEEDINNMPMGLHTVISEGSSTLSGGQRQRILIARAIVAKPRILFFDEATSALDNRTQAVVSESLERLKATRIVIAHRLSTIVKADRILVLQDGRLVQSGRYEELLAQPGIFAELARRQIA